MEVLIRDNRKEYRMLYTGNYGLFQNAGNPSRVSRSSVYQALCVPASCSHKDIEIAVSQYLQKYKHPAGVQYTATVAPNLCHTSQQETFSSEDYIFMLVQFIVLYVGINICPACFNFRNPTFCPVMHLYVLYDAQNFPNQH